MAVERAGELLTIREAAARLKVSAVTIKRYLKQGRLRAYRVGPRAIRLRREDVEHLPLPTGREATAVPAKRWLQIVPPSKEELARRKAVVEAILAHRQERSIAPLTTAELVRLSRDKDWWYGDDR
jgi:excisionase family DNA binding protein